MTDEVKKMTTLDDQVELLSKVIGPIQRALGGSLHINKVSIETKTGIKYKLIIEID